MEATSVTHLLKSFCDYTHWNYAVFWKLNHHLPMTLTWEDGYCGCQKENGAVESIPSGINCEASDSVFFTSNESTGDSGAYSVQPLMNEMSNLKYILGEGIVGEIALKGVHCWAFCEDVFTSNFNANIISECPYEWLLQFASGIKTIVVVPVLPHGVLQFGSFEAVDEDLVFVANVKEIFNSMCCGVSNTTFLSSDVDIQAPLFSSLTDCLVDKLDEASSISNNKLEDKLYGGTSLGVDGSTRLYSTGPLFIHKECRTFGEDQLDNPKKARKSEISSPYTGVLKDPRHIGQVDMNLSQTEEKLLAFSQWVNNAGLFDEITNETCSYSSEDMTEHFEGNNTDHKNGDDVHGLSEVSLHFDLHRALGHTANGQTAEPLWKYFSAHACSSSPLMLDGKGQDYVKDLQFLNEGNSEYLLGAVMGSLESALDDSSLSEATDVKPPVTLPRECTASIPPRSHPEESTWMVNYSDHENCVAPDFMAKCTDDFSNLVTSRSFDGNSSILINETEQEKVYGRVQPNSGPKLSSTSKKRARVGNTKRPRPRDRQLIMDRMKELRELVPDGAGCSIDNLLERTVKHMLHLRNITNQAEKLKRCLLQEVPKCDKQKTNGSHSGRSYAFDFESERQLCPMIIEELGCSGNMRIEMICSEHGFFLEIANVLRRMELTILKGDLESRSGTMWACFIVEVPRGFQRMDIMCPLLHILQQMKKSFK
ncbi:transcription factor EMB1444 [Neltuma alba]|uniref:transcription factor EMB1444 n=1 Tax=Neltuma alba TaxID=207710 RepID=UPI0010A469E2|nr:transcription factor EMB1444-like [Prosopis alba]XP_028783426.1 transcription factor EMB1444-like [Prosopis alba]